MIGNFIVGFDGFYGVKFCLFWEVFVYFLFEKLRRFFNWKKMGWVVEED